MKSIGLILLVMLTWQSKSFGQTIKPLPNDSLYFFTKYMQKNIHYPDSAIHNYIQGKVILEVMVNRKQTFTQIKVVKSPVATCDSEVVRVLKKFNGISPHHDLQLKPGRYRLFFDFEIDRDHHEVEYDATQRAVIIPIITAPPLIRSEIG